MRIGILGLPNVGKSTLFNAVTGQAVETSAYPFCTIDPNLAVVPVKEEGFRALSSLDWKEERPLKVSFVDVAGLVEGASEGQGLGNQFLAKLREMDCLLQVLRCFEGLPGLEGECLDPERDFSVVQNEILLSDLGILDKALAAAGKRPSEKDRLKELQNLREILPGMVGEDKEKWRESCPELQLLVLKPMILLGNVDEPCGTENAAVGAVSRLAESLGIPWMEMACRLEWELTELDSTEADEMRQAYGLSDNCLDEVLTACLRAADWISFYTVENDILGSWRLKRGKTAKEAAGRVHSDMAAGFHAVEVMPWSELVELGSWEKAKEKGRVRRGGREYTVKDGEVLRFLFSG